MKRYCLGFLFNNDLSWVVLLQKKKPSWQAGHWNGVGGSIEHGETAMQAMAREFKEEAGVDGIEWQCFAVLKEPGVFEIDVFYARNTDAFEDAHTVTDETVRKFTVAGVMAGTMQDLAGPTIGGLKWQLQMALSVATGEDRCKLFEIQERG